MGHYSESFDISRGTRQCCPLSPLILAIAIESLAIAIRTKHKCALFADNMLLFPTLPLISTPNVFWLLKDFGSISGLQVNVTKSIELNISIQPKLIDQLKQDFPFSWAVEAILYLWIKLTNSVSTLYTANYPHMFRSRSRTKHVVEGWPILAGQVKCRKDDITASSTIPFSFPSYPY